MKNFKTEKSNQKQTKNPCQQQSKKKTGQSSKKKQVNMKALYQPSSNQLASSDYNSLSLHLNHLTQQIEHLHKKQQTNEQLTYARKGQVCNVFKQGGTYRKRTQTSPFKNNGNLRNSDYLQRFVGVNQRHEPTFNQTPSGLLLSPKSKRHASQSLRMLKKEKERVKHVQVASSRRQSMERTQQMKLVYFNPLKSDHQTHRSKIARGDLIDTGIFVPLFVQRPSTIDQ